MQSAGGGGGGGGGGGYGGVSEMQHQQQQQQFMVDSLFSISTPLPHHHHHHHHPHHPNNNNSSSAASAEIPHSPHLLHHHQQIPNNHQLQLPSPHHLSHFSQHFPITQQLFHQPHHFQLFHHQQQHQQPQLGLDQESGPENSTSSACRMMGGAPSFLAAMDFKLNVNDSSVGGGRGGKGDDLNGEDGLLQGDGDDGSESRLHHHHHHHPWHADDDTPHSSAAANIKQPFWRPLDIDYINPNNKRPSKDKQPEEISSNKHFKPSIIDDHHHHHNQSSSNNNNTTPPNNEVSNAPTSTTGNNYKLFSELEAIYKPGAASPTTAPQPIINNTTTTNNHQTGSGSALTGDDNPLHLPAAVSPIIPTVEPHSDTSNDGNSPSHKKFQKSNKNRSKRRQQKHNQQLSSISAFFETLIQRLIDHQETLHRKFLDLIEKRDQERTAREDAWRAQESAKAGREAAARAQERALYAARESAIVSFLEKIAGEPLNLPGEKQELSVEAQTGAIELYSGGGGMQAGSSRWPKAEVQALIEVRSGLESRFQEPGLKGPLWEEVSAAMGRLGYGRSAKRCKEKWENINKYFRKAKDSGKKRPQQSKTCPYFQMLDQLYSNSKGLRVDEKKDNSELLDVIVDAAPLRVEHSGATDSEKQLQPVQNEEDEEEGQGESQDQQDEHSGDSSHLFHRLQT